MINEKQSKYISIISSILAVAFVVSSVFWIDIKSTATSASTNKEQVLIEDVLNKESITEINIDINKSDWQWLLENAIDEEYRSGNITINGETFYNVGIRPKGNSSLTQVARNDDSDRYSLKIDFDKYIDGQTYNGIEKLALNNMMSDATYMKEYLSYDLYEYLGVPTPEYSFTNIKINGEEWGLYLAVEVIDERFIEKHYGSVEGNLYKPETMEMGGDRAMGGGIKPMGDMSQIPNFDGNQSEQIPQRIPNFQGGSGKAQEEGQKPQGMPNIGADGDVQVPQGTQKTDGTTGASKVEQDSNTNNNGNKQLGMPNMSGRDNGGANLKYIDDNVENYSTVRESAIFKTTTDKEFEKFIEMAKNLNNGTNIDQYINVEEVLKYFAVNTFLVNLDSYSGGMYHNYYLYEKDGVFEIIPWDLNMSFAGFSVKDSSSAINFPIDSPVTGDLEDAPLIGKLLENDEYKDLYHSYLQEIVNEYINSGRFENLIKTLDILISEYVKNDTTAFYSYDEYKESVDNLIIFGNDRATSVVAQLNGEQSSTEYGTIATDLDLQSLGGQEMGKMAGGNKGVNNIQQVQFGGMPSQDNVKPQINNDMGSINHNIAFNNQIIIQICMVIVVLVVGILFVFKYKRKKVL